MAEDKWWGRYTGMLDRAFSSRSTTIPSLDVRVLNSVRETDRDQWNQVVDSSRCATVFHRFEWLNAIERGLDRPTRHLIVEKDGNIIAICPNVIEDIPVVPFRRLRSTYPGYGGPIASTDIRAALEVMLEQLTHLYSGRVIVHQIRAKSPAFIRYNDLFRSYGYSPHDLKGRFVLRTKDGYDEIRARMSRSRRRAIEQGRSLNHEIVREDITRESLLRFHELHRLHMQAVGGESFPVDFFEHLVSMSERLLLLRLSLNGEDAGAFLEILDEEQNAVHGFIAAVPPEYYDKHASELLYDHVIRWAIENEYDQYDFGGSGGNFEDGVFQFKESFGGEIVPTPSWERGRGFLWKPVRAGRSRYLQYRDSLPGSFRAT